MDPKEEAIKRFRELVSKALGQSMFGDAEKDMPTDAQQTGVAAEGASMADADDMSPDELEKLKKLLSQGC